MLEVNIEKIVPVTEARDMFNKIVDDVEGTDELYVLTKNGKPAAVVVGVNHLEKLTGQSHGDVAAKIELASSTPPPAAAPETPVATTPPIAPATEAGETVFASADDAAPATEAASSAPDPFAMASNELASQRSGAVAEPLSSLADTALTPTAASTESTGALDNISPVPEGFGSTTPAAGATDTTPSAPTIDMSAVEEGNSTSTLAGDPLAATETPAATEDSAAGPVLPPRQGI